jgi:signal transduction histidine kinase
MKKDKLDLKNINLYNSFLSETFQGNDISKIITKIIFFLVKSKFSNQIAILLFDNKLENISIVGLNFNNKINVFKTRLCDIDNNLLTLNNNLLNKIKISKLNPLNDFIPVGEYTALPLISNRKRMGCFLFLDNHNNYFLFKDYKNIIQQVSNILYVNIVIKKLEKKIEDISLISDISKEFSTSNLFSLLKLIVQIVLKRINAVSSSIMLLENDTLQVWYAQGKGIRKNYRDITFHMGEGAAGLVAQTGKLLFIENKIKDKRYVDVGTKTYTKNSYLGLPLIFKDKVEGVLNLDFKSSTELTDDALEFLQILASNAAISIRNNNLYDSSIRRIKRLSAIYEITNTISATLDLERILDIIVLKIMKILNSKICAVYLLNKEKTHLVPKSIYNLSGKAIRSSGIEVEGSISGRALIGKEVIYCRDLSQEDSYDKEFAIKQNLKSLVSIPLVIEDHSIGVINIYSRKIRTYSYDEFNFLRSFADQAAIAIEKAILYRHIKTEKERLSKLLKISNEISSIFDFEKLLDLVLKRSVEITNADAGVLLILKNNLLYVHDSIGHNKKKIKEIKLKLGQGITGFVAKTGKFEIIKDVSKDLRYVEVLPNQKSEAAFPIKIRNKVIGVLNLDSKTINNFEKHKDTLEILMDRIAVAIENSLLHRETKNFNIKLKEEINIATKSLIEANKRLIKMDAIKSDFISNVSHELRTPLTSIMGYSKLLKTEKIGEINDQQKKSLGVIVEESERLTRLINDLLDLSKMEKGKFNLNLSEIDVNEVISEVVETMCTVSEDKCIRIEVKANNIPKVYADRDKIKQILNNLLSNALKFTDLNGSVTIISKEKDNFIEIQVIDTGIGINEDQIPKLFDKFYQVDPSLTKITSGTGLGLSIALHLVDLHKGKIYVKSEVGKGSNFTFTIAKNLKETYSNVNK